MGTIAKKSNGNGKKRTSTVSQIQDGKRRVYVAVSGEKPGVVYRDVGSSYKNKDGEFDTFGEAKSYLLGSLGEQVKRLQKVRHNVWEMQRKACSRSSK
jgi:hypothetical protein